jgi:hypothetical protein
MATNSPRKTLAFFLSCTTTASALALSSTVQARDVKLGGGVTTGYEFYSRGYDSEEPQKDESSSSASEEARENTSPDDERYNRFRLTPLVVISSESARDSFSLRYSPSLRYDEESADYDVDQAVNANLTYSLTRDWQLQVSDRYVFTDQRIEEATASEQQQLAETSELSDNDGIRKYWKNDLSLSSAYRYWEDSSFSLGYSLGHLTHTEVGADSSYEDYVRHGLSLAVGHRFDSVWKLSFDSKYFRGLFEAAEQGISQKATDSAAQEKDGNDLHEFRAATQLEARHFEHHLLSLKYGFVGVDYDDPERNTTTLHDLTAGWQWQMAKDTSFFLGAGPSYNKIEEREGNWGYNTNARLRYSLERSAFEASVAHGYEVQNFTGTNESGLREFWLSRLDFSHQLGADLSMKLFTYYRHEDQEELTAQQPTGTGSFTTAGTAAEDPLLFETDTFNRQRLGAGTSLAYKFARWYAMNLSYNYLIQDSEKIDDSYDEHRLVLSLSMERDLFQW